MTPLVGPASRRRGRPAGEGFVGWGQPHRLCLRLSGRVGVGAPPEPCWGVQFEGSRSAEEIRKFWQNSEHPSINKQEWGAEELERLRAIAASHGHLRWQAVAEELGVRAGSRPSQPSGSPEPRAWSPVVGGCGWVGAAAGVS